MTIIIDGTNGISGVDGTAGTPAIQGNDADTGMLFPAANTIALSTGGSERLRLDSSGNLGLGVTPSAWDTSAGTRALQVNQSALVSFSSSSELYANAYFDGAAHRYITTGIAATRYSQTQGTLGNFRWFTAPSGTAGNAISFTQAMTLDASGNLGVNATSIAGLGTNITTIEIKGKATDRTGGVRLRSSDNSVDFSYYSASGVGSLGSDSNHPLAFVTSGTEKARITSGGDLLVGATSNISISGVSANHAFVASTGGRWITGFRHTTSGTPWGIAIDYSAVAPNDTSSHFLFCTDSAATRAVIRSNGGLANYQGNDVNLSDRREKTNFAPAKSYLDTICAIPVQTFNYIDQSEDDPGLTLGVVAQDVQAVAPELVSESNWGTEDDPKMRLSIYQTDLQYALMKCIQELKAQNDDLRARVAALEGNQP